MGGGGGGSAVIQYPSDLPACGSFAVGLGEHTEVGSLETCMEQLELEEGFRMLSRILSPAVGSGDET